VGRAIMEETLFTFDKLNNEPDLHKIQPNEASYAKNVVFREGAEKRLGETDVKDYTDLLSGADILGYFRVDADWALIFVGNATSTSSGRLYEWNLIKDTTHDDYQLNLVQSGLHESATWNCCKHQDDTVGVITACTNNEDEVKKYQRLLPFTGGSTQIYVGDTITGVTSEATATVSWVSSITGAWSGTAAGNFAVINQTGVFTALEDIEVTVGAGAYANVTTDSAGSLSNLISSGATRGKFCASFYDVLYLANVKDDTTTLTDEYGVKWSTINDSTDFSDSDNYFRRPEGGLPISTIRVHGDVLMLGKGNNEAQNQLWQVSPYSNCTLISDKYGPSNHNGAISTTKGFFFNDKGRILDSQGNHISQPVHTLMASAKPGTWELSGVENSYQNKLMWSTNKSIFVLDLQQQTWEMYFYKNVIQLASNTVPGRAFQEWTSTIDKHSTISVAEEDIMSDFVIIKDGVLSMMNHFSDDNEKPIEMIIESRLDASGDTMNKKRDYCIALQGEYYADTYYADSDPINEYQVYISTSSSPKKVDWDSIGTITLDSNGEGKIWLSGKRSIWRAIRIRENSRNPAKIYKASLRYKLQTQR
jgi:hypothetical protein